MSKRPKFLILSLIACSLAHLSMTKKALNDIYGILNGEDHAIEREQEHPALQSVPGESPHWESYNHWLCLPAAAMKIECRDEKNDQSWDSIPPEDRDGKGYYAVINGEYGGHFYRFESPGRVFSERCLEEIAKAKQLLNDQAGFCIFAAKDSSEEEQSQGATDEEASIWTYYGIKTLAGRLMAPIYDPELAGESEGDDVDSISD